MGGTRATSGIRAEQQLVVAGRRPRRGLAIDSFSCSPTTGIWYYRVDISVYSQDAESSTRIADEDNDSSSSDEDRVSDADPLEPGEVEHYSILRRYNDFLELYGTVRDVVLATEGDASCLPPFPDKELISPALVGMLWRVSSSKKVLEDRRVKFAALLQWVERHPVARNSSAFVKFLGNPPQSQDGYVSLKEYTSPDWLSSLQQVTKDMEGRKRRYSAGSNAIRSMLMHSSSEESLVLTGSRLRRLDSVREFRTIRVLGKRRNRPSGRHRRGEALNKVARLTANDQNLPDERHVPEAPQLCGKRKTVVQVEGNNPRKKQCGLACVL